MFIYVNMYSNGHWGHRNSVSPRGKRPFGKLIFESKCF